MINCTYYYSACIKLVTPDVSILCDPWFTDGAFNGSWYQYPKIEQPIEKIKKCDLIYVSHIHLDHYDKAFLRQYLQRFPDTQIIIADFAENYLARVMKADGFTFDVIKSLSIGETKIDLFPNEDPSEADPSDVDSALVCRYRDHSVINMNDCQYNQSQIEQIKEACPYPDIAFLSYTSAGPYPQTSYDLNQEPEKAAEEAERKKKIFLDRYLDMRSELGSKVAVPFAGKYYLGGKLVSLNKFRGVADATEVLSVDPNACVLADGGDSSINTKTLTPTSVRSKKYEENELQQFFDQISENSLDYERWFAELPIGAIRFRPLIEKAYERANRKAVLEEDFYICIKLPDGWALCNINRLKTDLSFQSTCDQMTPRIEIVIDPRLLFGLLSGVFHWANISLGSQFSIYWRPNSYKPKVIDFISFFHV